MNYYLVLLETSANQAYIYNSNKLRENLGASECTFIAGTEFVFEACNYEYPGALEIGEFLLDKEKNLPIEKSKSEAEIILATSGKALVLTKSPGKAREIVRKVTKSALVKTPGLTIHGAIVEVDDLNGAQAFGKSMKEVHQKLESIRFRFPSVHERFPRTPFFEVCSVSGLPAESLYQHESVKKIGKENRPYSAVSIAKQDRSENGRERLISTLKGSENFEFPRNLTDLQKKFDSLDWVAIVHADGNGLGELFINFAKHAQPKDGRDFIDRFRRFSLALDVCTVEAARFATSKLLEAMKWENADPGSNVVPLIPIILGGDDLTVVCDGRYGIKFTYDFLKKFSELTASNEIHGGIVKDLAKNAFGSESLGICAGVAIIKPHYPFHQAYGLATQLIKSAKSVKTKITREHNGEQVPAPTSALDFHVLYDTSGADLDEIRDRLVVDHGKTSLFSKPYIVASVENLEKIPWAKPRMWEELSKRVNSIQKNDEEDMPISQLNVLRDSLFQGRKAADLDFNLISHRYGVESTKELAESNDSQSKQRSLFFECGGPEGPTRYATHLLDALEIRKFWLGFDETRRES